MDDELRQGRVEHPILEGQLLRGGALHFHTRVTPPQGVHELPRRIHGGHRARPDTLRELGRQRARPAADVQHVLSVVDGCEVRERRGERHRIPAHEAVVRVGADGEAHAARSSSRP